MAVLCHACFPGRSVKYILCVLLKLDSCGYSIPVVFSMLRLNDRNLTQGYPFRFAETCQ